MPRPVLPGMTVLITRRTVQRTHLLRPDEAMTQLFRYCLAVVAQRHGILVHAAVLMSTHEHLVVTDVKGRLPQFLQELHRLVALGVKVLRNWEGAVWDPRKTSVVELRTANAVLAKIAYVIANPVAAGLVRRASEWPGVNTSPEEIGTAHWHTARPDYFFDPTNPAWPERASLELSVPPAMPMDGPELRAVVTEELDRLVGEALQHEISASSPDDLRRASPYTRATSPAPPAAINPTFAVGAGAAVAIKEALAALRAFRDAYRTALESWRKGIRDVLFPAGTWLMRRQHGVNVGTL